MGGVEGEGEEWESGLKSRDEKGAEICSSYYPLYVPCVVPLTRCGQEALETSALAHSMTPSSEDRHWGRSRGQVKAVTACIVAYSR